MTTLEIIGIGICLFSSVIVYVVYLLLSIEIDEEQRNTFERFE